MQAEEVYRRLVAGGSSTGPDGFDTHVVASILALALSESLAEAQPLVATVGLDGAELAALMAEFFPDAGACFAVPLDLAVTRSTDEACLVDLLGRCATTPSAFEGRLAAMIGRRAQRPNHLWQDLGLGSRHELSALMARHFAPWPGAIPRT